MDFAITTSDGISGAQTFDPAADLRNAVFISLGIRRGDWWFNTEFGLRDRGRLKNTERTARLLAADCRAALQWLIAAGRATAVVVTAERDLLVLPGRIKLLIEVTQTTGDLLTWTKFVEVA